MNERLLGSLLYPQAKNAVVAREGAPNTDDLGLAPIVQALDFDGRHGRFVSAILGALVTDTDVIAYRQAALRDLLEIPGFAEQLSSVVPHLYALSEAGPTSRWRDNTPLLLIGTRLADLESYLNCIDQLWLALDQAPLRASAWANLRTEIAKLRATEQYRQLAADLPQLRAQLNRAASVTVGINLDGQLQPESATVVSINTTRFLAKGGVVNRLLGDHAAADTVRGITALYKANEQQRNTSEHALFQDLARLLDRISSPVSEALNRYTQINATPLVALLPEVIFYLGAFRLKQQLDMLGLPTVFPSAVEPNQRTTTICNTYSISLALQSTSNKLVVGNNIMTSLDTPITLITGPNSGGKTTYARTLTQAQIMFQAGLFVAGDQAYMRSVDGIFSHFATVERQAGSGGRLAEELERLAAIFKHATPQSLIILNEPLTSTDESSARLLALDMVAGFKILGAQTILITHIHALVDDLVPQTYEHDEVRCLVAEATSDTTQQSTEPTYKIVPGRPHVSAYARELARHFGLSRNQLEMQLRDRPKS